MIKHHPLTSLNFQLPTILDRIVPLRDASEPEVAPLFPRLKFPQRGAQADVQRQNPAVRQPDHGFVIAHVIGDDAGNRSR